MLHIEKLHASLENLGQFAAERVQKRESAVTVARRWLAQSPDPQTLRERLAMVDRANSDWHGALPTTDLALDARTVAAEAVPPDTVLIAVDGSQIHPDRHAAVIYYLIQVGGLVFRYNGETPQQYDDPVLYFEDRNLYDERGYLTSAERVGMQRMVREMTYLADLAEQTPPPASGQPSFALTDGPLLWPYIERQNREKQQAQQTYLEAMQRLRDAGGVPVGYVDRPGGHPVLDLLWAGQLAPEDVAARLNDNPFERLTDQRLMAHILAPGERSVWFRRVSRANRQHAGAGQAIWFSYVNVGTAAYPVIARVEVPAWAAEDDAAMSTLHAALHHQSLVLGGYPYALARAHEIALVTTQDKAALDVAIQRQLLAQGVVTHPSEKARQKGFLSRGR